MQSDILPEDQMLVKCCQDSTNILPWSNKNQKINVWSSQPIKKVILLSHRRKTYHKGWMIQNSVCRIS